MDSLCILVIVVVLRKQAAEVLENLDSFEDIPPWIMNS